MKIIIFLFLKNISNISSDKDIESSALAKINKV